MMKEREDHVGSRATAPRPIPHRFLQMTKLFDISIGWIAADGSSTITRALIRRKRKSRPLLDEVEDGGRAAVIEEGVAALAFDYARRHRYLDGVAALDFQLLRTIKDMTSHLEVRQCTTGEWEQAILQGFEVWRAVLAARGGRIAVDLNGRHVTFLGPSAGQEPRV